MKKAFIIFLGLCLFQFVEAQSIYLTEKSGNLTQIQLSNLRSFTFSSASMFMNLKDGSSSSFALADVLSLKFSSPILGQGSVPQNKTFHLSPNPATDFAALGGYELKDGDFKILITDLQGRVVLQKLFRALPGNEYVVDVSSLTSGIYFCSLIRENQTRSIKFIKK